MKEESKKRLKVTRILCLGQTIIILIMAIISYITEGWWNSRGDFLVIIALYGFFLTYCQISRVLKLEQE